MTSQLTRRFSRRLLPILLATGLVIYLADDAMAALHSDLALWESVFGLLTASAVVVGAVFSQWRAVSGAALVYAFYLTLQGAIPTLPPQASELAGLLLVVALPVIACLPERGPLGPASGLLLALVVLMAGLALRGAWPSLSPEPAGPLFALAWNEQASPGFHPALAAGAIATLAGTGFQLWRPDATRGALLAATLCLLPLVWQPTTGAAGLVYAGGAVVLIWGGLLFHAWGLAFVDELTGLPNRRALELKLRGGGATLVMADVDHFKKFNDRWGHDAGDQALKRVAEDLAAVSAGGKAFRYGGEEFTLVFPGSSPAPIIDAVEERRKALAGRPFRLRSAEREPKKRGKGGGKGIKLTASFGVAFPRRGEAVSETLKRADDALYRAKKRGRNRLEFSE